MMAEYDCCECGVHVIAYAPDKLPEPPLCMTCLVLPGWFNDRILRATLGKGRVAELKERAKKRMSEGEGT